MESHTWAFPAALNWMQRILQERFGPTFSLQVVEGKTLALTHRESLQRIELMLDSTTFIRADSEMSCTHWNAAVQGWHTALAPELPAPGAQHLPLNLVEQMPAGYRIHYDILGLTYWMLTRQEEVGRTDLDCHGRFPASSSHAFRHGYLERPIVDEWLHILGQVISRTWPSLPLKAPQFSMKVSHDVDIPSRYGFCGMRGLIRAVAGDIVRRHDVKSVFLGPWVRLNSSACLHYADSYNTFDWIMDIAERHGLRSAFYFICGRTDGNKDADYEPEHPAIRQLMRRIHTRGHEIGLHPSYGSYQRPEVIVNEAQRLRRIVQEEGIQEAEWGGRMHYLRWETPTTLYGWEKAGAMYDSTLGYADYAGFRCGTCFEYPAFDPIAQNTLQLRIRPLIAMEGTIMAKQYMGLGDGQAAYEALIRLKSNCRKVGGIFTLLWHNSELISPERRKLYSSVLEF